MGWEDFWKGISFAYVWEGGNNLCVAMTAFDIQSSFHVSGFFFLSLTSKLPQEFRS
jgi:hypothetical protein